MFEDALVNMKKSYELYSNSDEVMWYLVRINSVAFEGEIGKILGHVETQFGFHLIYIDNRTDGELPDFEVVVNQVKSAALHDKQQKVYDDELSRLREKYI